MAELFAARGAARRRVALLASLSLALSACGGGGSDAEHNMAGMAGMEHGDEKAAGATDLVALTPQQIAAAQIELTRPIAGGGSGAIQAAALIESDPDGTRVVAVPIAGRIVALTRNLGDSVRRGQTLAIVESREAASLQADVARAQSRLNLARATLSRDRALFERGFRARSALEISEAAYEQARIDLRMAGQQVAASGAAGGNLNRIAITAPIAGRVIARSAVLGQVFMADASETELFRIADTSRLTIAFSLTPADAARVARGSLVRISAAGRSAAARISFVSPALNPSTRLVPVIARLDNPGELWRVGEPVSAAVEVAGSGGSTLRVPSAAVQNVRGRNVVFVRTGEGFRALPVTLAGQEGGMTIVTGGLAADAQVAATNSYTLKAALEGGAEMDMH